MQWICLLLYHYVTKQEKKGRTGREVGPRIRSEQEAQVGQNVQAKETPW